jgi:hypothetical protein
MAVCSEKGAFQGRPTDAGCLVIRADALSWFHEVEVVTPQSSVDRPSSAGLPRTWPLVAA